MQNQGLIMSKRCNEFIDKLRNVDIFSTNKNKYEKAIFFKILCYLHSYCGGEILFSLIKNFLQKEKSNDVLTLDTNMDHHKNNKFVDLLLPLCYIESLRNVIISPDIKSKVSRFLKEYIKHKYYQKNIITRFHRDVLTTLIHLEIDYEVENKDNFISKDIVLTNKINHEKVCIELNGEHHYYRDNVKNYQTEFKNKVLLLNGWKVLEVAHKDWKVLDEEKRLVFIRNILKI